MCVYEWVCMRERKRKSEKVSWHRHNVGLMIELSINIKSLNYRDRVKMNPHHLDLIVRDRWEEIYEKMNALQSTDRHKQHVN
jgi:hypothetical protein